MSAETGAASAASVAAIRSEVDQLSATVRDHLHGRDETTRQTFAVMGLGMGVAIAAAGLATWALVRSDLVSDVARWLDVLAAG